MLRPIVEIYEESAEFWSRERARSAFFEKKYMEWALARLPAGDGLLDLGCGSGFPIADFFLRNGIKVTGVDAAAAMIKLAAERFPDAQWEVADMRTLSLGRKFSAIIAWDSFFHLTFSEQEKMFPIFREHLLDKGVLVFTSGPERGEAIGDMNGNPLFHASLAPEEYRRLLKMNGLEAVSFHPNDPDCGGHSIWLCRTKN